MKFFDEYLFSCISIKKHYRLPIISANKCYFINDGTNSIVKIQDRKLLHSWTLEHPHCFTAPVVCSPEDNSLFSVIDNSTLLKWSLSDETLQKASKFTFQETIFSVLPIQKRKPLILFSSGKILPIELLYVSLEPMGRNIISGNEEIIWAEAFVMHSNVKVVCLGFSKKHNSYKLHCFSVGKKDVTDYFYQEIKNEHYILKNWCLDRFNFGFIAIWSNGVISRYLLHNQVQSSLLTIPSVKDYCLLDVSAIDADHIIVSICDTNRKETILEMWDTKFVSLKAKKVLKYSSPCFYQTDIINSIIFLVLNNNLLEVPFDVKKSTLATALGKSTEASSVSEYSWKDSTFTAIISKEQSEGKISVGEKQMDIDETIYPPELLAQRFMEEGSAFKTNNRESDLLELLRFAIRAKRKKSNLDISPDSLLATIFTSTFREATFCQYVRRLSLEETVIALETLLNFLNGKVSFSDIAGDKPSDSQLFDWIFLLMKSHTEALLLSKDKKKIKLLKKMNQCISEKIEEYEDYGVIQNMVYTLQKKENMLPTKHIVGKYFIETLDT